MNVVTRNESSRSALLVVSQYFAPDITAAAFRVADMTARLAVRGLKLTVLTAHPHKAQVGSDGYSSQNDITVLRTHLISLGTGGMLRYLAHYASFVVGSLWHGIRLFLRRSGFDYVWVSSPPLFAGISGLMLSKLFRCPLVFEVRDIWPDTAVAAGQISNSGVAYKVGAALETLLYKSSKHIVCVSQPMAEYVRSKTDRPVSVVYNGIDGRLNDGSREGRQSKTKTIVYAGNLGHLQALDVLLESVAALHSGGFLEGWEVVLVGTGAEEIRLKGIAATLDLSSIVRFTGAVSREEASRLMREADILYVGLKDHPVLRKTIPSKVFDCLLAAKPIVASIGGEGAEILGQTGANIVSTPGSAQELAEALRTAIGDLDRLNARSVDNRRLVMSRFTRDAAAETFANVLEQVLERNSEQ